MTLLGLEWSATVPGLRLDRMLHNGYQSWSYAGFQPVPATLAETDGPPSDGGNNEDTLGEVPGVSWWWSALSNADGVGMVVGASGGTVLKTRVSADGVQTPRVRITQGLTGDEIVLAPGESKVLDGLYLSLGKVSEELDAYTSYVASLHAARRALKPALGGWGSWNMYYASPTAAAIRAEASWAAANLVPLGLTDFLLDDGYETRWGSWQAAPSFGADLAVLNEEQRSVGLRPAVWMAPFYVAMEDPLLGLHPDWFVRRRDGALRSFNNFGPTYAALDVSSAGAREFVAAAVKKFWTDGYRTLKVDFLFGGALEAPRTPALTSLEAYQNWMLVIRNAAPEMHLVGCGAPLLPSVGWVDSMRVGADVAFSVAPAPKYVFSVAQARQTVMRAATDNLWRLDPDVVLLRGSGLSDVEAWTTVVSNALSGGNYLLGDARQAGELRTKMALSSQILELSRDGVAARAVDFVSEPDSRLYSSPLLFPQGGTSVPHVWKKRAANGKRNWIALFAWESEGYRAELSLPQGAVEVVAPGVNTNSAGARLVPQGGGTFEVPLHGVRLFAFEAEVGKP